MSDEGSRIAVLERRADDSDTDRSHLWESQKQLEGINRALASIEAKLDAGKDTFSRLDGDVRSALARVGLLEASIPKDIVARLSAIEAAQSKKGEDAPSSPGKLSPINVTIGGVGAASIGAGIWEFVRNWLQSGAPPPHH